MKKQITVGIIIGMITMAAIGMIAMIATMQPSNDGSETWAKKKDKDGGLQVNIDDAIADKKAPIATSGDNTYIAWWTNKTGNDDVMFRSSTDGGATFADKINLSNSTDAESQDVEIAADGGNVVITWWERNQTAEEPVARISTDNGVTFGPLLRLATNGTIS
jgi:hypothetical protein